MYKLTKGQYFILIMILVIGLSFWIIETKKENNIKLSLLLNKIQNNDKKNDEPKIIINESSQYISKTPSQVNSLDRYINPLRYPYKSPEYYDYSYANTLLSSNVVGGGRRTIPTLGGSQEIIENPRNIIDVSNSSITPIAVSSRGPLGVPQQMGTLHKLSGNEENVYPLFGRRKFPNGNEWEYYTLMGPYETKVRIITEKSNYNELGTNDEVKLEGFTDRYRVVIYETDFPQYIPYVN